MISTKRENSYLFIFFDRMPMRKSDFFCSALKIIFDLPKNMAKLNSYFSENRQPLNAICTTKNESFEHILREIKRERLHQRSLHDSF